MSDGIRLVVVLEHLLQDHDEHINPWDWQTDPSNLLQFDRLVERAKLVEDAGFHGIFNADFLGLNRAALERTPLAPVEPITILAALAGATSRIGLIGTISTQFTEPYNVARYLASLTQISRGRIGWNIVTSFNGEKNFGNHELPTPAVRYERAEEFIEVVRALWESWRDGFLLHDREKRVQVDAASVVDIGHNGTHFSVSEALDIPLTPFAHPVFFQAGSSEIGIDFAGKYAEAIFVATPNQAEAEAYVSRLTTAAETHGRTRQDIRVLPGLRTYIGNTQEEALAARNSVVHDTDLLRHLTFLGYESPDFAFPGLTLDDVIPPDQVPSEQRIRSSNRRHSRALLYREIALRPHTTLRDFLLDVSLSYAHLDLIGTPDQVADQIADWYGKGLADGFTLLGGNSLDLFIAEVLPRLERKGVFDPSQQGTDFRGSLFPPRQPSVV